jgi:hypothetical protein
MKTIYIGESYVSPMEKEKKKFYQEKIKQMKKI